MQRFKEYSDRLITLDTLFETNGVKSDYYKEQAEIVSNLNLNFDFLNNGISIESYYLLSESIIKNLNIEGGVHDKDSVVYITLCVLAIIFEEPKEKYRKIFEELRLRGIYVALKLIVSVTKYLKGVFEKLAELSDKKIETFEDMFSYIELFTPFMMASSIAISKVDISKIELNNEFESLILSTMRELKLSGKFQNILDKIPIDNHDNIIKYKQFKNEVQMIQDDKSY